MHMYTKDIHICSLYIQYSVYMHFLLKEVSSVFVVYVWSLHVFFTPACTFRQYYNGAQRVSRGIALHTLHTRGEEQRKSRKKGLFAAFSPPPSCGAWPIPVVTIIDRWVNVTPPSPRPCSTVVADPLLIAGT